MKKLYTLASITALALALPATGFAKKKPADTTTAPAATPAPAAAEAKKPAEPKADMATKHTPFYMKADSVDVSGKTFTHHKKNGVDVKFVITDKTEIKNGTADAKLSDIKVGDMVGGSGLVTKRGTDQKPTEYEVVKITKFGVVVPKEKTASTGATPKKKK